MSSLGDKGKKRPLQCLREEVRSPVSADMEMNALETRTTGVRKGSGFPLEGN